MVNHGEPVNPTENALETGEWQSLGGELSDVKHTRLEAENQKLNIEVQQTLAEKKSLLSSVELMTTGEYTINAFENRVASRLGTGMDIVVTRPTIKGKRAAVNADLTINAMPLVEQMQSSVSVPDAANKIVESLKQDDVVDTVESVGPFVNMRVNIPKFATGVFGQIETQGTHYGWYRDGEPEVVVVDYSSPNVAKNLTVAHLRSTIIGQSIMHLQEAAGNIPFGVNHIGDWGTHFGNIIYQYQQEIEERGDEFLAELNEKPAETLMAIYRKFNGSLEHMSAEEKQAALNAGRSIFLELEQGNEEYADLWFKFRDWSLENFYPIYERLNNVTFDAIQGESFYEDRMKSAVSEALEKEVLVRTTNGSVVFPSQTLIDPATMKENPHLMTAHDGSPKDEIILKPSGGTVYLTRDLAAIMYRTRELGASKLLYVIGKEQGGHCIELFNMAHQLGVIALGDAQHISFGHLNVGGRKMSSRAGKIMLLDQLLDEACEVAGETMEQRSRKTDEANKKELSEVIGIGATIFNDLRQDRIKDIEFDPERDIPKMLESGAMYVQYTHARLNSILEKAGARQADAGTQWEFTEGNTYAPAAHKTERDMLIAVSMFPRVVKEAAELNAPHKVANYLIELCQMINSFQATRELRVLDAESHDAASFRLALVRSSNQVINNAANLLHLQLPEKM